MTGRPALGRQGEQAAAAYLQTQGLTIREANWRPTGTALAPLVRGEIDLIATDGATLVFVEVRSRRGSAGRAEESVTPAKQRRLVTLARVYLAAQNLQEDNPPWRIDVVALQYGAPGAAPRIHWLPAAVDAEADW